MEEKKVEIAGAICAPPPESETTPVVPQPRQPSSLQGLLKFAMEATKIEDAPRDSQFAPLDENRKWFLEQALNSMTIDVAEIILNQVRIVEKIDNLKENEDDSQYTTALDTISDYVCDIDTANDFHKMGGFVVLQPCMRSSSPGVRSRACNLLAELTQNNAYCQRVVLENGFMPVLVNILDTDEDNDVVVKALYAISCIVRENPAGCAQLIQYKGVQVMLETLKRNHEKCNIKICFLLTSLCGSQADFRNRLVFVGYIPVLFSLISNEINASHEHVLALLLKLVEDNPSAINDCRQNKQEFKEVLDKFQAVVSGKEEFCNEEERCQILCNILFPEK